MKSWSDTNRDVQTGKPTAGDETTTSRSGSAASTLKSAASGAKNAASEAVTRTAESVSQGLSAASDVVADVMQNVELEEMTIRGTIGGKHAFKVNLEDESGKRYLAFHLDLRSEEGDELRVMGRKVLPAGSGMEMGPVRGRSDDEVEAVEGRTSPTGRGGY